MPTRRSRTVSPVLLASAALVWGQLYAQSPAPLGKGDFRVTGIAVGADSSETRRVLGAPLRITSQIDPYDGQGAWIDWHYRSLRVSYFGLPKVAAFSLTTRGVATARGLRVGDTRARTRALYGAPSQDNAADGEDAWVYRKAQDDGFFMKVIFARGRVTKIYVGYSPD